MPEILIKKGEAARGDGLMDLSIMCCFLFMQKKVIIECSYLEILFCEV